MTTLFECFYVSVAKQLFTMSQSKNKLPFINRNLSLLHTLVIIFAMIPNPRNHWKTVYSIIHIKCAIYQR